MALQNPFLLWAYRSMSEFRNRGSDYEEESSDINKIHKYFPRDKQEPCCVKVYFI